MYQYKAKVLKIIDGDTIDLEINLGFKITIKERFRLYGVNTPECRTRDKKEKKRGLAAKKFVEDRIKDREVRVDISKGQGKYGRYLAVIFYNSAMANNINLNDALIAEGHAKAYLGGKR